MRELQTPKGRYEFKGSEVIGHRRYYDDDGYYVEEIWTKKMENTTSVRENQKIWTR